MTTLIPIEHATRTRRGVILRRGARLGEASPLAGRSAETSEQVLRAIVSSSKPPPSLDFALWSLDAKHGSTPITSQVLLEDARTAIVVARAALARGQRAFKVKIRSRDDASVLTELRALAPEAVIRVDANLAFAHEREVPWDLLARASIEWIEEPCPEAGSLSHTPVAIALDESVATDRERALESVAAHRAAALVLKPTLLGASATLQIAERCHLLGGCAIVSHAFESEIGLAAAIELARRVDPSAIHGLARWEGIEAYRISAGGAPLASLLDAREVIHADSALG